MQLNYLESTEKQFVPFRLPFKLPWEVPEPCFSRTDFAPLLKQHLVGTPADTCWIVRFYSPASVTQMSQLSVSPSDSFLCSWWFTRPSHTSPGGQYWSWGGGPSADLWHFPLSSLILCSMNSKPLAVLAPSGSHTAAQKLPSHSKLSICRPHLTCSS